MEFDVCILRIAVAFALHLSSDLSFQVGLYTVHVSFQVSLRDDGNCAKEKLKLSEINLTVWCHFAH